MTAGKSEPSTASLPPFRKLSPLFLRALHYFFDLENTSAGIHFSTPHSHHPTSNRVSKCRTSLPRNPLHHLRDYCVQKLSSLHRHARNQLWLFGTEFHYGGVLDATETKCIFHFTSLLFSLCSRQLLITCATTNSLNKWEWLGSRPEISTLFTKRYTLHDLNKFAASFHGQDNRCQNWMLQAS